MRKDCFRPMFNKPDFCFCKMLKLNHSQLQDLANRKTGRRQLRVLAACRPWSATGHRIAGVARDARECISLIFQ